MCLKICLRVAQQEGEISTFHNNSGTNMLGVVCQLNSNLASK